MAGFLRCFCYLAAIGLLSFFLGRLLPKTWFRYDEFPYAAFSFEQEGKIYAALGIHRWKDRLPDMSRIFPGLMPSKNLSGELSAAQAVRMLQETCIAEFVHTLLGVMGFGCVYLWDGMGGWLVAVLFLLGNLPFNLIQRYNRPKLARILQRLQVRETEITRKERRRIAHEKRIDFEL